MLRSEILARMERTSDEEQIMYLRILLEKLDELTALGFKDDECELPLRIDKSRKSVYVYGEEKKLRPAEFKLFMLLYENQGIILQYEFLIERLWPDGFIDRSSLRQLVNELRKHLEPDRHNPTLIINSRASGYCLNLNALRRDT